MTGVTEKVFMCQMFISRTQKGPAERGHVKNRQEVSKIYSSQTPTLFDIFSRRAKIVKKCQKYFSTTFARHQLSGPFLGGSKFMRLFWAPSRCLQ